MIIPNKVINYNDSIINKMLVLLTELSQSNFQIKELYFSTQNSFEEIDEFFLENFILKNDKGATLKWGK
ncbi:ABC-three component system middle component 7 [Paenibacillus sp. MZ03-122A]|uniref:ABC-three component system middle component 7 n=1 Tax=Paenibacillus sp. MZ03-122A TaxID=2962033 RepID=UPI00349F6A70